MTQEDLDKNHLQQIKEYRHDVILEWREGVLDALDGGASKGKPARRGFRSSFSSSSTSTSTRKLPPPDYHEASSSSRLGIWPWLLRASHCCGSTILSAISRSTSLAVDNCNYRDSLHALGIVENAEYQWQTWDEINRNLYDPSV